MAALQLDANAGAGGSKAGTGSRAAMMNELLENMEKELDKLRRTADNIKVRKIRAIHGEYHEETEEEKKAGRDGAVESYVNDAGNTVIKANEKRV